MSTAVVWRMGTDSERPINLYKLFGLCKGDNFTLIKQYYKILLLENHPDKAQTQSEKIKRISMSQKITAAYEILSDEEAREVYDKRGLVKAKRFLIKKLKKAELKREEEYARSVNRKQEEERIRRLQEEEYQKNEEKRHVAKIAEEKREEKLQRKFDVELNRALNSEEKLIKAREIRAKHEAELVRKEAEKVLRAEERERCKKQKEKERIDAQEKKKREKMLKIEMNNIHIMLQEIASDIQVEKDTIEVQKKTEEEEVSIVFEEGLNVQREEYSQSVHKEIRMEKSEIKTRLREKKTKIRSRKKITRHKKLSKTVAKLQKEKRKLQKKLRKRQAKKSDTPVSTFQPNTKRKRAVIESSGESDDGIPFPFPERVVLHAEAPPFPFPERVVLHTEAPATKSKKVYVDEKGKQVSRSTITRRKNIKCFTCSYCGRKINRSDNFKRHVTMFHQTHTPAGSPLLDVTEECKTDSEHSASGV